MPFIDYDPPPPPPCRHPEHNPPKMMVLKPGRHVWECPACKATQIVYIRETFCALGRSERWREPEGVSSAECRARQILC